MSEIKRLRPLTTAAEVPRRGFLQAAFAALATAAAGSKAQAGHPPGLPIPQADCFAPMAQNPRRKNGPPVREGPSTQQIIADLKTMLPDHRLDVSQREVVRRLGGDLAAYDGAAYEYERFLIYATPYGQRMMALYDRFFDERDNKSPVAGVIHEYMGHQIAYANDVTNATGSLLPPLVQQEDSVKQMVVYFSAVQRLLTANKERVWPQGPYYGVAAPSMPWLYKLIDEELKPGWSKLPVFDRTMAVQNAMIKFANNAVSIEGEVNADGTWHRPDPQATVRDVILTFSTYYSGWREKDAIDNFFGNSRYVVDLVAPSNSLAEQNKRNLLELLGRFKNLLMCGHSVVPP
jgi:hypothetical protein